jgi:hypothetical protein
MLPASLAASVLIAGLGFVIGLHVRGTAPPQVVSRVASQDAGALTRAALLSPGYQTQRQQLLRALPDKLQRLPPDARQRVRDSLLAVQTAMNNIEAELGRDAGNALLQELFIGACQEEMRVLTAIDVIGGPNQEI